MKCLLKYKWLKLHRSCLPEGKGLMGYWARLASRAAFRRGVALYCGHRNPVTPGSWTGGIVGLKSILGVRRRAQALQIMDDLKQLGYINWTLEPKTKKLSYEILDWVGRCTGPECSNGSVYATEDYGFIAVPRSVTDRLCEQNRIFNESDAWLDLWCHTTYKDYGNAFSFLAPTVQLGKYGAVLTLDKLGNRWGWEKTKVWRFFRKYADTFSLYRLPGAYGCIVYNIKYLDGVQTKLPSIELVHMLIDVIRMASRNGIIAESDSDRLNRMIAWNSCKVMKTLEMLDGDESCENRVALAEHYTRAYFSHGRNCKYGRNSIYDCQGSILGKKLRGIIRCIQDLYVQIRGSPSRNTANPGIS